MPILKSLTSNKYIVKDLVAFVEQFFEQDSDFFIRSLDDEPLFTNIPMESSASNSVESLWVQLWLCFFVSFEKNWSQNCPSDFKPYCYR